MQHTQQWCVMPKGKGGGAQGGEVCAPSSASKSLQEVYAGSCLGSNLFGVWVEGEASVKYDTKVLGIWVMPEVGAMEADVQGGIGTSVGQMEYRAYCLGQAQL